jgi:hypothetical protein
MRASAEIKDMYKKLLNRKDYPDSISDFSRNFLEVYYTNFLPEIERDIRRTKNQVAEWKKILSDTNEREIVNDLVNMFTVIARKYIDRKSNYTDGQRFIKFYTDSVLQPLTDQYESNDDLMKLKRIIDVYWVKYYLYTGKPDSALRVAQELSKIISRSIDNGVYLVAAYLVCDQYDGAATLYRDTIKVRRQKINSDRTLRGLLNSLKEKNIALSNINRFISKELKLESEYK